MSGFFETGDPIQVPEAVTKKIMLIAAGYANLSDYPEKIADDIWICRDQIRPHEDRGMDGCVTYGIVLRCPDPFRFYYRDRLTTYHREGTPYLMDGRIRHGLHPNGAFELLAFMAWDIPHDYTIQGFLKQAIPSLEAWAAS